MRCRYTFLTIAVLAATPAYSDWFDNAVQRAIERTGTRAVDEGADAPYSGAKNGAKEACQWCGARTNEPTLNKE